MDGEDKTRAYRAEVSETISQRCWSGTLVQFLAYSTIAAASISPNPNEWLTAKIIFIKTDKQSIGNFAMGMLCSAK